MSFTAPGGPITLHFGGQFPAGDPEEWGIDNMVVTAVPEPTTCVIAMGAVVAIAGRRWARRMRRADGMTNPDNAAATAWWQ